MNRYYSIVRPVSLGTFPGRIYVTKIHNYGNRIEVPEIQQAAWGYLETPDKLTKQECYYYDLVEGAKREDDEKGRQGMMSISADEAIKHSLSFESPTEYRPVIHAHWITLYPNKNTGKAYEFVCSNCKHAVFTSRQKSVDELGYVFCPNCGAKMDERKTNEYSGE